MSFTLVHATMSWSLSSVCLCRLFYVLKTLCLSFWLADTLLWLLRHQYDKKLAPLNWFLLDRHCSYSPMWKKIKNELSPSLSFTHERHSITSCSWFRWEVEQPHAADRHRKLHINHHLIPSWALITTKSLHISVCVFSVPCHHFFHMRDIFF